MSRFSHEEPNVPWYQDAIMYGVLGLLALWIAVGVVVSIFGVEGIGAFFYSLKN